MIRTATAVYFPLGSPLDGRGNVQASGGSVNQRGGELVSMADRRSILHRNGHTMSDISLSAVHKERRASDHMLPRPAPSGSALPADA
jgi:hypothetical protein